MTVEHLILFMILAVGAVLLLSLLAVVTALVSVIISWKGRDKNE